MMSLIASDFFHKSPVLILPLVALGLFMLVFFAVTLRTLLTQKTSYDDMARLPLEGESAASTNQKEVGRE